MREPPAFTAFLGDGERKFVLPANLIAELERKTGRGIGGMCRDLFAGNFHHGDVLETIRLALIGGGENPQVAASLVATYVAPRPIMEGYALAVSILETAMLGRTGKKGRGK